MWNVLSAYILLFKLTRAFDDMQQYFMDAAPWLGEQQLCRSLPGGLCFLLHRAFIGNLDHMYFFIILGHVKK
jgi:hypothetical protein